MNSLVDLRRFLALRKAILLGIIILLILWQGVSTNPSQRRERHLNERIAEAKIGHKNSSLQQRLQMQFTWLGRHAGVRYPIAINHQIHPQQLTLLGFARSFTSSIERGKKDVRLSTLVKLANIFGVHIRQLFNEK